MNITLLPSHKSDDPPQFPLTSTILILVFGIVLLLIIVHLCVRHSRSPLQSTPSLPIKIESAISGETDTQLRIS